MKCSDCPLSLRCLAGRLGHLCFCPDCHYIVLEDVTDSEAVRLRCERRGPEVLKGTPPIMDGQGIIVPDPVGGFMGIAQCAKCEAAKRRKLGWKTQPEAYYNAQEIDKDEL